MPERFSPEYLAHLASPLWRHKREQAFKEHGAYCQRCFTTQSLDVHHLTYKRLGNERMDDLAPLCRACHDELHLAHDRADEDLWHFSKRFIDSPVRVITPWHSRSNASVESGPQDEWQAPLHIRSRRTMRAFHLFWLIPLAAIVWLNAVAALAQR